MIILKRILVVASTEITLFPPTISLLYALNELGYKITLVSRGTKELPKSILYSPNIKIIDVQYLISGNVLLKLIGYLKYVFTIRRVVREQLHEIDYIWTTTDRTVSELGRLLLKRNHILQLMELIQSVPMYPHISFLKFPIEKYARNALCVVVPEENRAHILKAWWRLKKLPTILPNKPVVDIDEIRGSSDMTEKHEKRLLAEKRKIILYQGLLEIERNIAIYAEAISSLNDEYALYVMGRRNQYSEQLLTEYPNVCFIDHITPPYHLRITKMAHIGVLNYEAHGGNGNISELNSLYCAPNKVYEYSMFGIPMLGNRIPGLINVLENRRIGCCHLSDSPNDIISAIRAIEKDYETMSKNAKEYYANTDYCKMLTDILNMQ